MRNTNDPLKPACHILYTLCVCGFIVTINKTIIVVYNGTTEVSDTHAGYLHLLRTFIYFMTLYNYRARLQYTDIEREEITRAYPLIILNV